MKKTTILFACALLLSIGASAQNTNLKGLEDQTGLLSNMLAGRIAGLMVSQYSAIPGDGAKLWIRGQNISDLSSYPLVLVDGVERSLDLVNAEDIESIEVLKDASATALYGVRAANGVILVTTKRGIESAPVVKANAIFGAMQPLNLSKLASTSDWISYYNELYTQTGAAAPFSQSELDKYLSGEQTDRYPSVDWMDAAFNQMAVTTKINVNVTGGTSKSRYYITGSYFLEDGLFAVERSPKYNPQLGYSSFNFLSNLDVNLSSSTTLNFGISTQYSSRNSSVSSTSAIMENIFTCTPIATPLKFSDGSLAEPADYDGFNPYNNITTLGYKRDASLYAQARVNLIQDFSELITSGLKFKLNFALSTINGNTLSRYRNPLIYYINPDTPYNSDGSLNLFPKNNGSNYLTLGKSVVSSTIVTLDPSITYDRDFDGHKLSAAVLGSLRYMTENVPANYIYAYPYKHLSLGGRLAYTFKNRYFIDISASYSGSDNFEKGYRYGLYPAVSLAYDISEEPFWEEIKPIVNTLKLKASYGRVGSDNTGESARRFVFNSTLATSASGATFGTSAQNTPEGISTSYYGYDKLAMENSKLANFGLELGLFKDLSLSAEYYSKKSEGIYVQDLSSPAIAGMTTQYKNVGALDNSGIELALSYAHEFSQDFSLSAYGTFSYNRSKVINDSMPEQKESYQNHSGYRLGQQFGLEAIGLFSSEEEISSSPVQEFGKVNPGDIKYKDQNNDNVINSYDMIAIGKSAIADINYGFGLDLRYKKIDFSVRCNGVSGVTRVLSGSHFFGSLSNILIAGQIYEDVAKNRWTLSNPDANAKYPRMYLDRSTNNSLSSTFWQRDMSFLRISNISLGYSFTDKLRIYANVLNPLTISSFKLWDPEMASDNGIGYPKMRTLLLGLNLSF